MRYLLLPVTLCFFSLAAEPVSAGDKFKAIDDAVNQAIAKGDLPGAVVLVLHEDKVVHRKAYGQRAKRPEPTLMTEDTIFDLASLTKPIFAALAILLLGQDGKLSVDEPIGKYLPEFARRKETAAITIAQLLIHTSGFPANNAVEEYRGGKDRAWEKVFAVRPEAAPGSRFKYSSFGYILLGKIVEKVSGTSLEEFGASRIYGPLGMKDTTFHPSAEQKKRCAPTEQREGRWMIGEVHDPRAHVLGEAGHAGLFSTVDDLAIFARMMLNDGKHAGKSILRPETVKLMTAPRKVMDEKGPGLRTYGWDMDTIYSSNRGEIFKKGESYGHTGFTGTSIWIDPASRSAVIVLTNRVHPDGKGNVVRLRGQVATIAGRALLGK